jgi:dTDP-4-dehydrorhamnose 3,5-epimerase
MTAEVVDWSARSGGTDGLFAITLKHVTDDRGTVRELSRRSVFEDAGLSLARFAQVNITESGRGVVRGMHAEAMTKLVGAQGRLRALRLENR